MKPVVGAGGLAVEGGLHAGEAVEGVRGREAAGEGFGQAEGVFGHVQGIAGVARVHFLFEQAMLDVPEAVLAPGAEDDLLDQVGFRLVGGLEAVEVILPEKLEFIRGFAVEDGHAPEDSVLETVL
jgi:hypothetical protein